MKQLFSALGRLKGGATKVSQNLALFEVPWRRFARDCRGDPDIVIPDVLLSTPGVIVSEWLEGRALSSVIDGEDQTLKDRAGFCLSLLRFSAPARCGLLHADLHPGNFLMLADGRLGVFDLGAVARLPDGIPVGRRAPRAGLPASRRRAPAGSDLPVQPAAAPSHRGRGNPLDAMRTLCSLNLPPEYLLMHRAGLATLALLCRLGATAPYRSLAARWQPGLAVRTGSTLRAL